MQEKGLIVDFPLAALQQAEHCRDLGSVLETSGHLADLRALPWTSIDNDDSLDLDQLEVVFKEDNEYRLLVAVADVDMYVGVHSPIDEAARVNTTSVYTGVKNFPMLPERLSFDLTSLLAGKDRRAMVAEMRISANGLITGSRIFPALVQNKAKLCYDAVANWLEGKARPPEALAREKDLRLQVESRTAGPGPASGAHGGRGIGIRDPGNPDRNGGRWPGETDRRPPPEPGRKDHRRIDGGLQPVNGRFSGRQGVAGFQPGGARARALAADRRAGRRLSLASAGEPDARALSGFLRKARQAKPDAFADLSLAVIKLIGRGEYHVLPGGKIPEGHFGLALNHYAHSTAPNRRYPDLADPAPAESGAGRRGKKRLFPANLQSLAQHCTQQEDAANKVERQVKKCAAAELLGDKRGCLFSALVTGSSDKGTWVRIKNPPVEGKLVRGNQAAQGRRPPARPAGRHQRGKGFHRLCPRLSRGGSESLLPAARARRLPERAL